VAIREGSERFAPLYLIHADREHAGPGALRLADIIRERVGDECERVAAADASPRKRRKK
jgi:hypothetical protein